MKKLAVILSLFLLVGCSSKKINLSEQDRVANYKDTTYEEIKTKIKDRDSFIVYVTSNSCLICHNFNPFVEETTINLEITIYKVYANTVDLNSPIMKKTKYTPAVFVFKKGKIIEYLDPTKNKDSEYFDSQVAFEGWLSQYLN